MYNAKWGGEGHGDSQRYPADAAEAKQSNEIDYTLGDKEICRGKQKELVKELVSTSMKEFEARSSKA